MMPPGSPTAHAIREATLDDLSELVRLEEDSFATDLISRRQIRYQLTRGRGVILVIDRGDRLAGAAYLMWRSGGRTARLYSIAVESDSRGTGAGRALLRAAEARAIDEGLERMSLEVRPENRAAVSLYESCGYRVTATLPAYYEDGGAAVRMARRLRPDGRTDRAPA